MLPENYYCLLAGSSLGISSGEVQAKDSICPKGWQLPASEGDKSFQNLMEYGYGVRESAGGDKNTGFLVNPLSFPRAGNYETDGNISNRGSYGYAWSSKSSSGTDAYYLYFASGYLNYRNNYGRGIGRPVRCVAR